MCCKFCSLLICRSAMEKKIRNYGMEVSGRRSHYNKPHGSWNASVPTWEKQFCKVVGLLDWEEFLDLKKSLYLYDNVLKWDDSAGKEAFQSAKNRFWAELNGIPCDVNFPNPDLYIDDVDWDCKIDDQLLSDLDCRSVCDSDEKSGPVIIFGDSLTPNLPYSSTGWGETKDMLQNVKDHDDQWRRNFEKTNGRVKQNGARESHKNTCHLDKGSGPVKDEGNVPNNRNINNHGSWGTWDNSNANRVKAGMSRYKVSRFHVVDDNFSYSRINEKGKKKETFAWEQNDTELEKTSSLKPICNDCTRPWSCSNSLGSLDIHLPWY
ncbi:hypothetical protein Leryth_001043 [Lithospermum erythrorhizon]|nr:hypothetical protein Leryth_001043 [Lithospermum erythrorhizon]